MHSLIVLTVAEQVLQALIEVAVVQLEDRPDGDLGPSFAFKA